MSEKYNSSPLTKKKHSERSSPRHAQQKQAKQHGKWLSQKAKSVANNHRKKVYYLSIKRREVELLFACIISSQSLRSRFGKMIKITEEKVSSYYSSAKHNKKIIVGERENRSRIIRKFLTNMSCEQLFAIHYAYCCELFTYLILFEFSWWHILQFYVGWEGAGGRRNFEEKILGNNYKRDWDLRHKKGSAEIRKAIDEWEMKFPEAQKLIIRWIIAKSHPSSCRFPRFVHTVHKASKSITMRTSLNGKSFEESNKFKVEHREKFRSLLPLSLAAIRFPPRVECTHQTQLDIYVVWHEERGRERHVEGECTLAAWYWIKRNN